jgi:tRNA threonylcarbamoyladenosine biosynthesis protein TsaE
LSEIRAWKKIYLKDLEYVVSELKEVVKKPACIILSGEVGSGKTTFVKYFLPSLKITSPTYSILNEIGPIAHADFYRLKDQSEILELELGLYLENKEFFLVEWGMQYLNTLRREVENEFAFYELKFLINQNKSEQSSSLDPEEESSRSLFLHELD